MSQKLKSAQPLIFIISVVSWSRTIRKTRTEINLSVIRFGTQYQPFYFYFPSAEGMIVVTAIVAH